MFFKFIVFCFFVTMHLLIPARYRVEKFLLLIRRNLHERNRHYIDNILDSYLGFYCWLERKCIEHEKALPFLGKEFERLNNQNIVIKRANQEFRNHLSP